MNLRSSIDRLLLWKRFVFLSAIVLALATIPTCLYIQKSNAVIRSSQHEVDGMVAAIDALKVIRLSQQYRGLTGLVLSGVAGTAERQIDKQHEVDQAYTATINDLLATHEDKLADQWRAAQRDWNTLRTSIGRGNLTVAESFAEQSVVISELLSLSNQIDDAYGFSQDPEIPSSELLQSAFYQLPYLTEEFGKIRGMGSALLAKKSANADERTTLIGFIAKGNDRLTQVLGAFSKAATANPDYGRSLGEPVRDMTDLAINAMAQATAHIVAQKTLDYAPGDFFYTYTQAIDAQFKVIETASNVLKAQLTQRNLHLKLAQWSVLSMLLLLGLLAALLQYLIWGLTLKRLVKQRTTQLDTERVHLRALVESIPDLVWVKDSRGVFLSCNPAFERVYGAPASEIIGKTDYDFCDQDIADSFRKYDELAIAANGPSMNSEWVTLADDGTPIMFDTIKTPMRDAHGNLLGVLGIARDVTERHQAEAIQKRLNRALKLISECNHALVHAEEEQKLLTEICRLAVGTGGYLMAWVGFKEQDPAQTVRPVAWSGDENSYLSEVNLSWGDAEVEHGAISTAVKTGVTTVNQDYQDPTMALWSETALRHGFRSSIGVPLINRKRVLGVLGIHSGEANAFSAEEVRLLEELAADLAYGIETLRARIEHEASEKKLEFLAHHDPLTGLPNRLLLRDRFEQAAANAYRESTGIALMFLDLDNFKNVNDSLGHGYGDQLLIKVVERLHSCVRDTDTISRQGGDEFVILISHVKDFSVVGGIAQGIMEAFAEPIPIDGYMLNTSFSVGISLYPHDGRHFDTLLKLADTALHQAKDSGRNNYRFFVENMNANAQEQVKLQGQLHSAIKNQEFILHYQPQIEIHTGRIVGVEALIRWQHPERGLVPPGMFIPLAERSGLIIPIGAWVLNEACQQAQAWRERGLSIQTVAVNLSGLQFKRGNLLETVQHALGASGLPADQLELELTESILLQDVDAAIQMLQRLSEMGVKLSIDDFGTGYSSLSYLKRLAVNKLKIDQSFVRDLTQDPDDAAIVKTIIQLGHNLQLTVIAEGVETPEQLAFLQNYGCDEAQGYLISRPVPAAAFVALYQSKLPESGA